MCVKGFKQENSEHDLIFCNVIFFKSRSLNSFKQNEDY